MMENLYLSCFSESNETHESTFKELFLRALAGNCSWKEVTDEKDQSKKCKGAKNY